MTTRFSEAEAAEVDAARGSATASAWIREVCLAAARASGGTVSLASRGHEKVTLTEIAAFTAGPASERAPKNCKHPNLRVKGVCPDCHEWAVKP